MDKTHSDDQINQLHENEKPDKTEEMKTSDDSEKSMYSDNTEKPANSAPIDENKIPADTEKTIKPDNNEITINPDNNEKTMNETESEVINKKTADNNVHKKEMVFMSRIKKVIASIPLERIKSVLENLNIFRKIRESFVAFYLSRTVSAKKEDLTISWQPLSLVFIKIIMCCPIFKRKISRFCPGFSPFSL